MYHVISVADPASQIPQDNNLVLCFFCMLSNFLSFWCRLLTYFQNQLFQKILSGALSECQTVLIQIRTDILSECRSWSGSKLFAKVQLSKFLKIGTCPASQKVLTYMGKNVIFTRNFKIFTCPAAWGTREYERMSAIFEPWGNQQTTKVVASKEIFHIIYPIIFHTFLFTKYDLCHNYLNS